MVFDEFWKRFVSFGLMFSLGLLASAFLYKTNFMNFLGTKIKSSPKIVNSENDGNGASGGAYRRDDPRNFQDKSFKESDSKPQITKGIEFISKPRANYTDEGKLNQVQGKVVLRVTFSANGQIGSISTISCDDTLECLP